MISETNFFSIPHSKDKILTGEKLRMRKMSLQEEEKLLQQMWMEKIWVTKDEVGKEKKMLTKVAKAMSEKEGKVTNEEVRKVKSI